MLINAVTLLFLAFHSFSSFSSFSVFSFHIQNSHTNLCHFSWRNFIGNPNNRGCCLLAFFLSNSPLPAKSPFAMARDSALTWLKNLIKFKLNLSEHCCEQHLSILKRIITFFCFLFSVFYFLFLFLAIRLSWSIARVTFGRI